MNESVFDGNRYESLCDCFQTYCSIRSIVTIAAARPIFSPCAFVSVQRVQRTTRQNCSNSVNFTSCIRHHPSIFGGHLMRKGFHLILFGMLPLLRITFASFWLCVSPGFRNNRKRDKISTCTQNQQSVLQSNDFGHSPYAIPETDTRSRVYHTYVWRDILGYLSCSFLDFYFDHRLATSGFRLFTYFIFNLLEINVICLCQRLHSTESQHQ